MSKDNKRDDLSPEVQEVLDRWFSDDVDDDSEKKRRKDDKKSS